MKSSPFLVSLLLMGLVSCAGVLVYYFYFSTSLYDTAPIIFQPHPVPKEHEPFKKEVLLINLHRPAANKFTPDTRADFLGALHPRHYENRTDSYDYPWSMDFLPNQNIVISIHHSGLYIYDSSDSQLRPLTGLPDNVATNGYQLGFLDVLVDPDFANNKTIYFTYTAQRQTAAGAYEYTTCVVSSHLENLKLDPISSLCFSPWREDTTQFGGALAVDDSRHLFISMGDSDLAHI